MVIDSYTCELCIRQSEEILRLLFLRCSFSKNCWMQIGVIVPVWLRLERATRYIKRALWGTICNGDYNSLVLLYMERNECMNL
jgi:hypothetical protein